MPRLVPPGLLQAFKQDRSATRDLLLAEASFVIAREARDRAWFTIAGVAVAALAALGIGQVLADLGYLDLVPSSGVEQRAVAQLAALAAFVASFVIFIGGRLQLIRSELDLLRLHLEMFAGSETGAESSSRKSAPAPLTDRPTRGANRRKG